MADVITKRPSLSKWLQRAVTSGQIDPQDADDVSSETTATLESANVCESGDAALQIRPSWIFYVVGLVKAEGHDGGAIIRQARTM